MAICIIKWFISVMGKTILQFNTVTVHWSGLRYTIYLMITIFRV